MSVTPDKSALAQARERLEKLVTAVVEQGRDAGLVAISPTRLHWSDCASDLRLVLDALRDARERHDWMIDQAAWLRHEHTAYVAVPVPLSSDLSSKATRAEAVDRAFQAHRAALAAKEQQP